MKPLAFNAGTLAAFAAVLLATSAHAGSPFSHPAVRDSPTAEPGWAQARTAAPRFVGHPASPRWATVPASGEWVDGSMGSHQHKPTVAYAARAAVTGKP